MTVTDSIIAGILQGLLEFLPVSSFGHITVWEQRMNMGTGGDALFEVLLHFGTLAALFFIFRKDIRRLFIEFIGILLDVIANIHIYFHNRRSKTDDIPYNKVISSLYRKLTVMILVTMLPTALLGFIIRNLMELSRTSEIAPGVFFLLTGIFLLVTDFSKAGGRVMPHSMRVDHALWIGIFQGISAFPGLSRCGLTVGTGLFCGFNRKFAVKYSYLASIPAVIGAFFVEIPRAAGAGLTFSGFMLYVPGILAAGIIGYLVIRIMLKLTTKLRLSVFAVYCFLAGACTLALK